jgi:hypothetical protein
MLLIAGPSVICETEMAIIQPLDLHIVERTRATTPKNSDVSTRAGEL